MGNENKYLSFSTLLEVNMWFMWIYVDYVNDKYLKIYNICISKRK